MARCARLTILQANDTHGYLEPHPEILWDGAEPRFQTLGGYARIAALFNQARAEHPAGVIALDNGDTQHGTFAAVHSKGRDLVPLLNALAYDAMTAHWDFAYGPSHLVELARELKYPVLAANCYRKSDGKPLFPSYQIVERGGLHVGTIGIAALVDKMMPPKHSEGLTFNLGNEELPLLIAKLRQEEHVDLIIVLSHLGFPQDVKLATEIDGIDILLSGHTHNRLYELAIIGRTIIMQSGCHGSFIGRLDIDVENGRVEAHRHRLIAVDESIEPDRAMQAMVDEVLSPHRAMLRTVVGQTNTPLHRATILEAPMDNFLLSAAAEAAGTPLGFSNGWRYGAPIVPGDITMNDLWNIVPVNPPLSIVELSGDDIPTMMEENLENTFASDPYKQMGGYVKRCFGFNLYIKIENPRGQRIQRLFANGHFPDRARRYQVVSLTSQSVPTKFGTNRRELGVDAIDAPRQYLGKHPTISIGSRNTVVAI